MFQKIINAISILSFLLHVVYISTGIMAFRLITSDGFWDPIFGLNEFKGQVRPEIESYKKEIFPELK